MKTAPLTLLACAALGCARLARAQDSQFGIAGLGTPGRWESVAARTGGGAFAAFDPTSPLSDATLADVRTLTASAGGGTTYRQVEGPSGTTWLRNTRYPTLTVGGPVSKRLSVGGGYSTYLDRTYNVVTRGDTVLRGVTQSYTDAIASDGGVTDVRVALAARLGTNVAVGVGLHLLAGSTRMTVNRRFDDSTAYVGTQQKATPRYDGVGASASALVTVTPTLSLALLARGDGRLSTRLGDTLIARSALPATLGGALRWAPVASARFAGSVLWRSWSRVGQNAFDTVNWTAGLELGGAAPFRVGVRGGQLPFATTGSAPTEWGVSVGVERAFARGRGILNAGLERLARDGGALHERVWTVLFGLAVRP